MTQPTLLLKLLALAENPDDPEAWIHSCLQAADEAEVAIVESELASTDQVMQAIRHVTEIGNLRAESWQIQDLIAVGKAYVAGTLQPQSGSTGAAMAFRNNLPPMRSRKQVQSFVACVAVGVLRGYILPRDANVLLYGAQAALSAFPKRKPRAVGKQVTQ